MSRKQKTAKKKAQRAATTTLQYEASYGSKSKLSAALVTSGAYANKKTAAAAIDRSYKGERLSDKALEYLRRTAAPKSRQEAEAYRERVAEPRAKRGKESAQRRNAKKIATDELKAVGGDRDISKTIEKIRKTTKHSYNESYVQFGEGGNTKQYARLVGVVENYHGKGGPRVQVLTVLLWDTAKTPSGRLRRVPGQIDGWDDMNGEEKATALADFYEHMTSGVGELKAFEYKDYESDSTKAAKERARSESRRKNKD